ncbi:MAG: DNA mismatch repair protein MutL, partial [Eubacteriales bacterium]|nr:DNA mismatch repair protein MutL [Eubacteriales bacterium]
KLNFDEKHIPEELQKQADAVAEQAPDYGQKQAKPIQQSLFEEGELAEQATKEIRIIGQVFSTYWIMEYEDKMYMVDQHAAHEKVLYERFMKSLREKQPMIQMVQPPIVLTLSMTEQQALTEHEDLFASLGFQIESFGGREYAVSGVPAHLPSVNTEDLLIEALDMLSEYHGGKTPEVLLDRVATMSCKAAVKGNNKLDVRQAEELIREMMTLENPYHCPHGRPTMISMTKRELEKKFKRIV